MQQLQQQLEALDEAEVTSMFSSLTPKCGNLPWNQYARPILKNTGQEQQSRPLQQ